LYAHPSKFVPHASDNSKAAIIYQPHQHHTPSPRRMSRNGNVLLRHWPERLLHIRLQQYEQYWGGGYALATRMFKLLSVCRLKRDMRCGLLSAPLLVIAPLGQWPFGWANRGGKRWGKTRGEGIVSKPRGQKFVRNKN